MLLWSTDTHIITLKRWPYLGSHTNKLLGKSAHKLPRTLMWFKVQLALYITYICWGFVINCEPNGFFDSFNICEVTLSTVRFFTVSLQGPIEQSLPQGHKGLFSAISTLKRRTFVWKIAWLIQYPKQGRVNNRVAILYLAQPCYNCLQLC